MKERDEKRGGAGCLLGLVMALPLLPVLYVLRVVPAAWLDSQFPQPSGSPIVRTIYVPLDCLAEKCEPIGAAIHWYVSLWA